jgi:hypothetical protein
MKSTLAQKAAYIGAGAGIALFVIFGLTYGALIGGIFGLSIAKTIVGAAVNATIGTRLLVALGMLSGVMASGLMFCIGGAAAGWVAGYATDLIRTAGHKDMAAAKH